MFKWQHAEFNGSALKSTIAAGLMVCGLSISQAHANVVNNGGFDDMTGWTGTWVNQPGGSGFPTIDTGTYYWGGNNGSNAITQTYMLTASDLLALGSTGLNFLMSADLFGFSTQGDSSSFAAEFLDAGMGSLGTNSLTSTTNDPGTWGTSFVAGSSPNFQSLLGSIPTMTKSILFTVSSIRTSGSSNDGYLDNASFTLTPGTTVVPLPAALPLFAGGVGMLGLLGWRRKRQAA